MDLSKESLKELEAFPPVPQTEAGQPMTRNEIHCQILRPSSLNFISASALPFASSTGL